MIKSWIFEQMNISSCEDPLLFNVATCTDEYSWRLDMWGEAETLNYHGLFFSEHHFNGVRICPSPGLFAAAVAARTTRLRIGMLGLVLPLWQPWRAIEEIGMLDHLSRGRLEVGVARGSNPREAAAVGIEPSDLVPMYNEALDILDKAWREPVLSHRGRYWSFDNLAILPRPVQQPSPPIWATIRSVEAAAEAARRGHKACTGFLPTEQVKELFDAYRQSAQAHGRPSGADRLAIRRCIFVAPSSAEAQEHAHAAREQMPSILQEDTIAGSPEEVAEQILAQMRYTKSENIVGFFAGNRLDRASVQRSYRLFGTKVIPVLRRASSKSSLVQSSCSPAREEA